MRIYKGNPLQRGWGQPGQQTATASLETLSQIAKWLSEAEGKTKTGLEDEQLVDPIKRSWRILAVPGVWSHGANSFCFAHIFVVAFIILAMAGRSFVAERGYIYILHNIWIECKVAICTSNTPLCIPMHNYILADMLFPPYAVIERAARERVRSKISSCSGTG